MNKQYTWEEFEKVCKYLAKKLKKEKIDAVYGVARGGLCLAVKLSHLLNIPLIPDLNRSVQLNNLKNVVIVDDVSDTGETLITYNQLYPTYPIVTWHIKPHTKFIPLHYYEEVLNDIWVIYPWEKDKQ